MGARLTRLLFATALSGSVASAFACSSTQTAEPAASKLSPPPNDTPTVYGLTLGKPFIDVDEWRDTPRRHRYMHGGFENSHLRFSVYLPPKELYQERFLLMLEGGQGGQDKMMVAPSVQAFTGTGNWDWVFNLAFDELGAYLVETNEGHWPDEGLGVDNPHDVWQASGYATRYVRNIAAQIYGTPPKHGYVNGCSGGGSRGSQHIEHMPDLIDGAVPQAWGGGLLQWAVYAYAGTLLGDKTKDVIDALEVGGSGDPYKGLSKLQADALRDLLAMGYIRDGISQLRAGWPQTPYTMYRLKDTDPSYYEDFWTKPGYAGHDNPKEFAALLIDTTVTVEKVLTVRELQAMSGTVRSAADVATYGADRGNILDAKQGAIITYDGPPQKLMQATATILSGPDAGKTLQINGVGPGNLIRPFIQRANYGFNNVQAGDKLKISNRDYIAYMYAYRHLGEAFAKSLGLQTATHRQLYPEMRAMMDAKGQSKYVQRTGRESYAQPATFKGRMIALSGTADEPIWPTGMTVYERRVRNNLGENAEEQFRFWFVNNHAHCGGSLTGPRSTIVVPATGLVSQALRDVVKWVEEGVPPPGSTGYHFADDNALVLEATAQNRKGIQPVVTLAANGGARAEVPVGTPVKFTGTGEVPPGTGFVVKAQFDFDGQGTWPESAVVNGSSPTASASATYAFTKPGTYFPAFRVGSHRDGAKGKGELIYNLARARVVVKGTAKKRSSVHAVLAPLWTGLEAGAAFLIDGGIQRGDARSAATSRSCWRV